MGSLSTLPQVEITPAPVEGPEARDCIRAYLEELNALFPGGFDPERSVSAAPTELAPPHGVFLLVRVDAEVAGCGGVKTLSDEGIGEIKRMWIASRWRGRGLGRLLLAALEDAAARLGHETIRLDTSAHLREAIALYQSAGYREIADYNQNAYAAHWFEKDLK